VTEEVEVEVDRLAVTEMEGDGRVEGFPIQQVIAKSAAENSPGRASL